MSKLLHNDWFLGLTGALLLGSVLIAAIAVAGAALYFRVGDESISAERLAWVLIVE